MHKTKKVRVACSQVGYPLDCKRKKNEHKDHCLNQCLDDIDKLASYLKVLYRSTAFSERQWRDRSGHFTFIGAVNEGGDNEIIALALSTLEDLRSKIHDRC
jgi:hypothetical protein